MKTLHPPPLHPPFLQPGPRRRPLAQIVALFDRLPIEG